MLKQFFLTERNMMIAILLNAVIIFLLYFPSLHRNIVLEIIDEFFIVLFLLEALVKIKALGSKSYFSSAWHRFDFFIVIVSIPSLFIHFLPVPDTSLFLLLRLFRLIRLVRFISFIPNMDSIMEGLGRALRSSVFVLLALFFLNFLLAIFSCHFYGNIAPELFGNPLRSFFSIFQMFTVEGWNEIPTSLALAIESPVMAWIMRFYFGAVVLIGGIFGLSLANAVFVDEMTIDNNEKLEEKIDRLQEEIRELKDLMKGKDGAK
ncbi:MAG: ion transporter [Bacteroidota bacterium]